MLYYYSSPHSDLSLTSTYTPLPTLYPNRAEHGEGLRDPPHVRPDRTAVPRDEHRAQTGAEAQVP